MILTPLSSRFHGNWSNYLVIYIRNIHDKLDVITEIVGHDPPKDILCYIVSTQVQPSIAWKHVKFFDHTVHGPYVKHRILWDHNYTISHAFRCEGRIQSVKQISGGKEHESRWISGLSIWSRNCKLEGQVLRNPSWAVTMRVVQPSKTRYICRL